MTEFTIKAWLDGKTTISIFGVLDNSSSAKLPLLSKKGNWIDFRTVREHRFVFASEAKQGIAIDGYFLMGAGLSVNDSFGET